MRASDRVFDGRLDPGVSITPEGRPYVLHEFTAREGDEVVIDLMSSDFDAMLYVHSPSGQVFSDDDGGDGLNSRLSISVSETGTWKAFACALGGGETRGAYQMRIRMLDASQFQTMAFTGVLADSSPRLPTTGAAYGEHTVSLQAGQEVRIDLMSSAFDALLHVHSPSGEVFRDDDGGEGTNSRLTLTADQGGVWRIIATAYGSGGTGEYRLNVRVSRATAGGPAGK